MQTPRPAPHGRIVCPQRDRLPAIRACHLTARYCTGLGAKALFDDEELTPVKGQLTVLLPQPEVDYIALLGDLYMFPRADGILLSGTTERDVWDLVPNEEAKARILQGHRTFFAAMRA